MSLLLQSDAYSCGAFALHSVFETLGYDYDVATLGRVAKTNPVDGTDEKNVIKACIHLEHPVREIEESHPGFALVTLRGFLLGGAAAMLAVDQDSHWIAVIGVCGHRFIVHDPAAGTFSYSDKELIPRWQKARAKLPFYAVVILPRSRR